MSVAVVVVIAGRVVVKKKERALCSIVADPNEKDMYLDVCITPVKRAASSRFKNNVYEELDQARVPEHV